MPAPDLENFAGRSFSFYPPILNIEHNEWTFAKNTWSEILVHNTKSGKDIWVPRRFLGEISRVDEPVMIVGLKSELEYKGGSVWPHKRRVLEMPRAAKSPKLPADPEQAPRPAPPPSRESAAERKMSWFILSTLAVFIGLAALGVFLTRSKESGGQLTYQAIVQRDFKLTGTDGYFDVVRELGEPSEKRWKAEEGERQYQALEYAESGLVAILMGPDRDDLRYIGAMDRNWKVVHTVLMPDGADTGSILRSLEKF